VAARGVRARLPALLALPHAAALLRAAVLVHPHHRGQGRAAAREREDAWYPETVKWGRYGDWLRNNVDWALSRNRYWGTPLPIWRNDADPAHLVCVGSLAELGELAGEDLSDLDPHRPYVDDVTFTLPECDGTFRRVPEVIDVWYDSGAMPFAQWGYPHLPGSREEVRGRQYPAQYICEALDQTRGWFYTLMAVGTLVFDRSSYENVLCLGHILAEDGRKMSKHLGNVLEPIPLMDEHGADAVRWFMAASGSPWLPRRVGHASIQEVVRKVLLTYWNTASFQSLYGRLADWNPAVPAPEPARAAGARPLGAVRAAPARRAGGPGLRGVRHARVGSLLSSFVDDLSNWYVRRSRRRFWDGDPAALATLHECLDVLTRLLAPLVPFITERVWQDLVRSVDSDAPLSVHLAAFPSARGSWSTTSSPGRSRSSAGSSSSGGRRAPRRRCAPASRWPRRSSGPAAGTGWTRSCAGMPPRSSTCWR
jgi:isoleucyl-tRNA synthetase